MRRILKEKGNQEPNAESKEIRVCGGRGDAMAWGWEGWKLTENYNLTHESAMIALSDPIPFLME